MLTANSSTSVLDPPTGTEQIDQSDVGFIFADDGDDLREAKIKAAMNLDFTIPPGANRYTVPAVYQSTQDTFVHALAPPMHYRGRSFRFTANYPDDSQEILLDVPRYDFNWQNTYVLKDPKLMPEGAVMMCHGVFDNSDQNLVNPDPTATVRWGDQSGDEMMLGTMVTSLGPNVRKSEYPKVKHIQGDTFDVTFRYRGNDNTKTVAFTGSFNDWNKALHPMDGPDAEGFFKITIHLKARQHEYNFVVNGDNWIHDPENPNRKGPFNNTVVRVRK